MADQAPLSPSPESTSGLMTDEDFDALQDILDGLQQQTQDDLPPWEFWDGFITALVVSRRVFLPSEYLPLVLQGTVAPDAAAEGASTDGPAGGFPSKDVAERFLTLWMRRWNEIALAVSHESLEDLGDERALHPYVLDLRGALAGLEDAERSKLDGADQAPYFAQLWASGFLYAVQSWEDEWKPPRDRELAESIKTSLEAIAALTEDDLGTPTVSMMSEDAPPSVSEERLEAFGRAVWAVYDLREAWRLAGPRVATVRRTDTPGRNDLCSCGSGKKYKKCCGA